MWGLTAWLTLVLLMSLLTLWAVWARNITRWRGLTFLGFLLSTAISGGAILLSQGWSTPCSLLLPGTYNLIGYLPKPDDRIDLFLDTAYGPKVCYIDWDAAKSDELQDNEEENGSQLVIQWGGGEGGGIPGVSNEGEI